MRRKKRAKKKTVWIIAILCAIILLPASFTATALDGESSETDPSVELDQGVDSILKELDLSALEEYIAALTPEQSAVFGGGSAADKIKRIVSGEIDQSAGSFFGYLMRAAGIDVLAFLPVILAILAIAVATSLLNSAKPRFASDSVGSVISFSGTALSSAILSAQILFFVNSVRALIVAMQTQIGIVFPIILTLMAASGASASAGVYQPAVAIMAGGIMELIVLAVLPFFILSSVFSVVGNLSETVKLKKMSSFFMKASVWILGTAFFLFLAFLSVQGITASVYDGVSVRTAKFAISKYVPVIGGYLSDGFNLVMAGSVLVKNAVGMTAVVLLILTVLPVLSQGVILSLSMHLCAAIVEPLGDKRIGGVLTELGNNTGKLIAVLLGAVFIYFIFLILVICTGNVAL